MSMNLRWALNCCCQWSYLPQSIRSPRQLFHTFPQTPASPFPPSLPADSPAWYFPEKIKALIRNFFFLVSAYPYIDPSAGIYAHYTLAIFPVTVDALPLLPAKALYTPEPMPCPLFKDITPTIFMFLNQCLFSVSSGAFLYSNSSPILKINKTKPLSLLPPSVYFSVSVSLLFTAKLLGRIICISCQFLLWVHSN